MFREGQSLSKVSLCLGVGGAQNNEDAMNQEELSPNLHPHSGEGESP